MGKRGRWYRKPIPEGMTQVEASSPKFKACGVKLAFNSEKEAEEAITKAGLSKSGHRRGSSYKCRYCEWWHVTSKKAWVKSPTNKKETNDEKS